MKNYYVTVLKNNGNIIARLLELSNPDDLATLLSLSYASSEHVTIIDFESSDFSLVDWIRKTDSLIQGDLLVLASNELPESAMREINFRKCDSCGRWITPQEYQDSMYCGNNIRYCKHCAEIKFKNLYAISCYHGDSTIKYLQCDDETMTQENFKGYGFEIEIDNYNKRLYVTKNGAKYAKVTDKFYELNGKNRKTHFKFESDGSLCNGYEIISHVMSEKYLRQLDFKIITDYMLEAGHDNSVTSAGIHLHASKSLLGETSQEQVINFLKLQYFMTIYKQDFIKLSKRNENNMYYCSFYNYDSVKEYAKRVKENRLNYSDLWTYIPASHSYALISSGKTIEIRIFRSVADPLWIKNCFLLFAGIINNIASVPFNKIYCMKRMFKGVDENVIRYFRNQGIFMHTYASEQRGEDF